MVYGELLPHGLQRAAPGYQLRHEKSYGVDVGLSASGTASHSSASSSQQFQHESWPRPLESIRQHVPSLQSVWVCSRLILMFVYEIAKFEMQFSSTQWAGNHYPSLNLFLIFVPVAFYHETLSCRPAAPLESSMKSPCGQTGIYYAIEPQPKASRTDELGGSRMNVVPIHHGSLTADPAGG